MKTRISLLIAMLLVLQLVLAACGGGDVDTAKNYVEAAVEGDKDEAEKHVCDENKDILTRGIEDNEQNKIDDLKCEEDGDNIKCTFKNEGEAIEMKFAMKDGKVCEILFE